MGLSDLCGDGCPQQLFGCPFSLPPMDDLRDLGSGTCCPSVPVQLQSQPSPLSSQWAGRSPPSCHDDLRLPGSCFYQLHMCSGPLVPEGPDCGTACSGTGSTHGLQVEFSLSPSASPPSSALLPSHFQAFGSLPHPSPVQHPRSLTQWRRKSKLSGTLNLICDRCWYLHQAWRNQDRSAFTSLCEEQLDLLPVLENRLVCLNWFWNWDTWTLHPTIVEWRVLIKTFGCWSCVY